MNTPRTNEESYPFIWMNEERSTPEGFAKHIFDWGMQSFPLKPELYRAQRDKAISQMKDFVSAERTARLEAEREAERLTVDPQERPMFLAEIATLQKERDEALSELRKVGEALQYSKKMSESIKDNCSESDKVVALAGQISYKVSVALSSDLMKKVLENGGVE